MLWFFDLTVHTICVYMGYWLWFLTVDKGCQIHWQHLFREFFYLLVFSWRKFWLHPYCYWAHLCHWPTFKSLKWNQQQFFWFLTVRSFLLYRPDSMAYDGFYWQRATWPCGGQQPDVRVEDLMRWHCSSISVNGDTARTKSFSCCTQCNKLHYAHFLSFVTICINFLWIICSFYSASNESGYKKRVVRIRAIDNRQHFNNLEYIYFWWT